MEYVVLALLILSPMTIYDINKSFENGISGFYSQSYGGIQNAIKNLIKKKFIVFNESVVNGRNKKVYSITEAGTEEFFNWMYSPVPDKKQETNILTKLYFLGLLEDDNRKREVIEKIISAYESKIKEFESIQKEVLKIEVPQKYEEVLKYQKKTLELGLLSTKTELNWFRKLL